METVDGHDFDFRLDFVMDRHGTDERQTDEGMPTLENEAIEGSYYEATDGPFDIIGDKNATPGQVGSTHFNDGKDGGIGRLQQVALAVNAGHSSVMLPAIARPVSNGEAVRALPTGRLSV